MIGALVLAAGASRRFGSDKRGYLLDGRPMLARTLEAVQAADLACRVCLGPEDGYIPLMLGLPGLEFIECPNAASGMGATLADGVRACTDWDALLVVLGDMPWVTPDTYRNLAAALERDAIVQPEFEGRPGQPVGFGADFFPELMALEGDIGGRDLLRRHPQALRRLPVGDSGIHRDLDEPL